MTPQNGRNATNAKSPPCHLLLARLPSVDRNLLGDQGQLRSPAPVDESALKAGFIRTCVRRHPAPLPAPGARDDQHDLSQLARRAPRGAQPPTALSKKERRLLSAPDLLHN